MLARRAPVTGDPLFTGTTIAEAAGDALAGPPVLVVALVAGLGATVARAVSTAALSAMAALLAVTFSRVAHAPVQPERIATFVLGTTALLSVVGLMLAAALALNARAAPC